MKILKYCDFCEKYQVKLKINVSYFYMWYMYIIITIYCGSYLQVKFQKYVKNIFRKALRKIFI